MRWTVLPLAIACGGDKLPPPPDSSTDTSTMTTGSAGGAAGGTVDDRTATLNGSVLDCAGAPLADVDLRFCDPLNCRYYTTEAGIPDFSFPETKIGWNSLEAVGPAAVGTGYVPLEFADQEVREITLTMCPFDAATNLSGAATEIELGTGLLVTLSSASIEPPTFVDPATAAQGLWLDPAHHVPMDGITGTVAAQWWVEPFNHTATGADLPVRFDGAAIGLAAATYHGWLGSYDDFGWLDLGTFSDNDADGFYTSDAGTGLPLLGTVALVE